MATVEFEFNVDTDFKQFLVFDSLADWGDLYEKWTPETIEEMFVQGDGYIAVGTMRAFHVPVVIRLGGGEPLLGRSDRTSRGVLAVPSGTLVVSGVSDNGASGGTIEVAPGTYWISVDYLDLGSIAADEISGDDRYVVTLNGPIEE
ncbi:hypothetical protein [Sinomonas sp. ASV322]|uniref:hypothetical protein n=1 Tax=Sinomonas sp. ASV322 TaxID=3041920 RepID=UPI0027DCB160|nr:hypothetical protein [Sinomonas sp. ASV322]MDQ4504319.1 hypothetical protein [Sinomonas sp. ASV322]